MGVEPMLDDGIPLLALLLGEIELGEPVPRGAVPVGTVPMLDDENPALALLLEKVELGEPVPVSPVPVGAVPVGFGMVYVPLLCCGQAWAATANAAARATEKLYILVSPYVCL